MELTAIAVTGMISFPGGPVEESIRAGHASSTRTFRPGVCSGQDPTDGHWSLRMDDSRVWKACDRRQ